MVCYACLVAKAPMFQGGERASKAGWPGSIPGASANQRRNVAQSPRYDFKIRRKGGYQWASETDLEGLQFWHGLASKPSTNPQYEAKDKEKAKRLSYWVSWRESDPYSRWKGVRGDSEVVALQPSDKPTVHSWDSATGEPIVTRPAVNPVTGEVPGDDWKSWDGEGDDPIPF